MSGLVLWLGVQSTTLVLLGALYQLVVKPYLATRIEKEAEAAVTKRLNEHQHQLDKQLSDHNARLETQLEVHRSTLAHSAARLASNLHREATDDAIYVAERHKAVTTLYAKMLEAVQLANAPLTDESGNRSEMRHERMTNVWNAARAADVAYRELVLYLPDAVDKAALRTIMALWMYHDTMEDPPDGQESRAIGQTRRDVNERLEELLESSRAELRRSRPDGSTEPARLAPLRPEVPVVRTDH